MKKVTILDLSSLCQKAAEACPASVDEYKGCQSGGQDRALRNLASLALECRR